VASDEQGGVHLEDALPRWDEGLPRFIGYTGGIRGGGHPHGRFHCAIGDKEQGTPSLPHLAPPTRAPTEALPLFAE